MSREPEPRDAAARKRGAGAALGRARGRAGRGVPPRPALLTLRDRAAASVHRQLADRHQAAVRRLAEFAERGVEAPSLDAICARAGHTRGAFYVHFRSREDFMLAVMERMIGPFLDEVIVVGDAAHDLEDTVDRFAGAVRRARDGSAGSEPERSLPPFASGVSFHRVLEACARSDELRSRVVRLLGEAATRLARAARRGQKASTVREDVDADALSQLLLALALGVITTVELGMPFDLDGARKAALRLLARGKRR